MALHRYTLLALGGLGAGIVLRLGIALRTPVSYDEVFVMGIGLDEMLASTRAFLVDVPLRRSNAITPLWWWLQAVPALLAGRISLWGLRVMPLLLGGVTLTCTFLMARRRLGRGPAALFIMFAAVSDILAFCHARGEFAESLLVLWLMPCLVLVGAPKYTVTKGVLGGLILMTHLGKGLFLVGTMTLADALAQVRRYRTARSLIRPVMSMAIAALPTLGWLALAAKLAGTGPMMTDIGPVAGPGEMLWKLTAAYAQTKRHMVGSRWDAAQVWLDGWVWPVTSITAVPTLVGMAGAVARWHGRRGRLCLGLTLWVGAGLMVVVARGVVGARFHLLYLPAAWLTAAIGLWRLRRASGGPWLALGGLWAASVWVAFSWASWTERRWSPSAFALLMAGVGVLAVGLASLRAARQSAAVRAAAWCGCGTVLVLAVWARGPLRWAPFSRMEPHVGRRELAGIDAYRVGQAPLPDAIRRTLYIDLANYFITKEDRSLDDLRRAEYYSELETQRVPGDAGAWFYLGETLRQLGAPTDRVRSALERSYELRPTPLVEQRLRELGPTAVDEESPG